MKKKIFIILSLFLFSLFLPFGAQQTQAKEKADVNLYFFYGDGCPHCAKEEVFLKELEKEKENLDVYYYETWYDYENAKLLSKIGKELDLDVSGVPILLGGDRVIIGYYNEQTTGKKIKDLIEYLEQGNCVDQVGQILGINSTSGQCKDVCSDGDEDCLAECGCAGEFGTDEPDMPQEINLPFIGQIDIQDFSLPALTILIGALDGFNPCAMWVLLFLISLLLGMENRKKMWLLGLAFIFASSAVYFLFLTAWLNLFLFLGFIFWIRIIIGLVALGSGGYHLREYIVNRKGTCHVTSSEKRKKIFEQLKNIVSQKSFLLSLVGIVLLAAAVNLVELVCSAGLPAIYTQVLTLSDLPSWQYYGYLLLYILFFMIDDLFIFVLAMVTLQMQGISAKYTRWSNLIGGIIMLIIGLLLIFKPGWLMFG